MQFKYPYYELDTDFNDSFYTETERIALKNKVELDFVGNMSTFLLESALAPKDTSVAIASSVFARMSDKRLHYHTPMHVLAIFQFHAKFIEEPLTVAQQLAIWFHDSIYNPESPIPQNEYNSAGFMKCMLEPLNRGSEAPRHLEIMDSTKIIFDTAKHLEDDSFSISPSSRLVMDLDLSSFAGSYEIFIQAGDLVRLEYPDVSDERFMEGRKKFMGKLRNKGFIFRSETFKKAYETRAMENIEKFLAN